MARFGAGKKSKRGKRKPFFPRVKGKQNARMKPVLPKKGVTQTSYEAGFFDFLKVFWKNNSRMELCSLTKQVVNAWDALMPKPKLSKRRVLQDYRKEFEALQEAARRDQMEKEEKKRELLERKRLEKEELKRRREKVDETTEDTASETEASSRTVSQESIRNDKSRSDDEEHESRSENAEDGKSHTDDESMSEKNSVSQDDSGSEFEDVEINERRRSKRKRKGRKYKSYDEYLKKQKKFKANTNNDNKDDEKGKSHDRDGPSETLQNRNGQDRNSDKSPEEKIFFPMRGETSFDRIVRNNFDDREEMLRNFKLRGSDISPDNPDNEETKRVNSGDSFSSPIELPKFPMQGRGTSSSGTLSNPTDTLHVKNLVVGIRQPDLQEIFRVFLKDIVLIRVLDNKFNGEAVVEFKTVEAAEKVWRQMNGVEYKRLPLVLEFANKEDLLY